jgi:broad specificity phosphatase PhoE
VTTLLLVRHGAHDLLGKAVAGRAPGVGLNALGRAQAHDLARWLPREIHAIYCSPQQRAVETAQPLAAARGLPVTTEEAFDEIDFGRWTGLPFDELRADSERWNLWVERKSVACPPGGEPFARVHERAMSGVERLAKLHHDDVVLVVTHGDIIKAVMAGFLGVSLDHLERFDIAPASLSIVMTGPGWAQVKLLNGQATVAG